MSQREGVATQELESSWVGVLTVAVGRAVRVAWFGCETSGEGEAVDSFASVVLLGVGEACS